MWGVVLVMRAVFSAMLSVSFSSGHCPTPHHPSLSIDCHVRLISSEVIYAHICSVTPPMFHVCVVPHWSSWLEVRACSGQVFCTVASGVMWRVLLAPGAPVQPHLL